MSKLVHLPQHVRTHFQYPRVQYAAGVLYVTILFAWVICGVPLLLLRAILTRNGNQRPSSTVNRPKTGAVGVKLAAIWHEFFDAIPHASRHAEGRGLGSGPRLSRLESLKGGELAISGRLSMAVSGGGQSLRPIQIDEFVHNSRYRTTDTAPKNFIVTLMLRPVEARELSR